MEQRCPKCESPHRTRVDRQHEGIHTFCGDCGYPFLVGTVTPPEVADGDGNVYFGYTCSIECSQCISSWSGRVDPGERAQKAITIAVEGLGHKEVVLDTMKEAIPDE